MLTLQIRLLNLALLPLGLGHHLRRIRHELLPTDEVRDAAHLASAADLMGRILVRGEPGAEIISELAPLSSEIVIDKPGKGAFYSTSLGEDLAMRRITHLLIAGVTTEVCVQTTMREANDRGFDCLLVEDATESYFPEFKAATLAMVRAQGGIVGWTAPAGAIMGALHG